MKGPQLGAISPMSIMIWSPVALVDRPSKPGKPEVKDSDKTEITIQWDPPAKDGGAPILGYNVERKDPRTGRWNKINKDLVPVSQGISS